MWVPKDLDTKLKTAHKSQIFKFIFPHSCNDYICFLFPFWYYFCSALIDHSIYFIKLKTKVYKYCSPPFLLTLYFSKLMSLNMKMLHIFTLNARWSMSLYGMITGERNSCCSRETCGVPGDDIASWSAAANPAPSSIRIIEFCTKQTTGGEISGRSSRASSRHTF